MVFMDLTLIVALLAAVIRAIVGYLKKKQKFKTPKFLKTPIAAVIIWAATMLINRLFGFDFDSETITSVIILLSALAPEVDKLILKGLSERLAKRLYDLTIKLKNFVIG